MPASPHEVFHAPPDPNVAIWRYMDFTKYVSMLANRGLFFVRASVFEDPFEGSLPRANQQLVREPMLEQMRADLAPEKFEIFQKSFGQLSEFRRWFRLWITVSSWHMNEHESAAMWRLYSPISDAIAVRSTYTRLAQTVPESTYVGTVAYKDYSREPVDERNALYAIVHKRKSYEHERELRAVRWKLPTTQDKGLDRSAVPSDNGEWVPVDLSALVVAVYVAPQSPPWFADLVRSVSRRYDLEVPTVRSSLEEEPFF